MPIITYFYMYLRRIPIPPLLFDHILWCKMFKLYLDPGHGRMDPGAIGNGMQEKEITLNISHSIRNLLASEISWKTIMKACKLK